MINNIRTDLALEAHEIALGSEKSIPGISVDKRECEGFGVTCVVVESDEAGKRISKPKGSYITIEAPSLRSGADGLFTSVSSTIAEEIRRLLNLSEGDPILVAGLGNRRITPDSLGPAAADKVFVTRHILLKNPGEFDEHFRNVCAISPGVMGITGIETSDLIAMLARGIKPAAVIAIDALASRSLSRLATTIQISDAGIAPGSGVSRREGSLDPAFLGTRIVSIGVPTVVDAATLASDALMHAQGREISRDKIARSLPPIDANLFVTPNNIDELIDDAASIIACGINLALHDKLSRADVEELMS